MYFYLFKPITFLRQYLYRLFSFIEDLSFLLTDAQRMIIQVTVLFLRDS